MSFSKQLINNYKSESENIKTGIRTLSKYSEDIHGKIRPNILERIPPENTLISKIKPDQLLVPERFDIMAKYIYARNRELKINSDWALQLYLDHIRVFNGFDEPDGTGKKGAEHFIKSFHSLLYSIRPGGFENNKSLIPIGQNNILLDGSHRIGACLLYNKEITGLFCDIPAYTYDYLFFKNYKKHVKTGLDNRWLDAMALEYCRIKQNTYIVTLFPSASGNESEINNILKENGKIVYSKKINLKRHGPLFLMLQMYSGENWLGNWKNGFLGARQKASLCFTQNNPMRIYLIECDQLDDVMQAKNKIRNIFKIGKHSVHINDHHEETLRLAKVFFNQNSIHFLNHARPELYKRFNAFLDYYMKRLEGQSINSDNFCIDGSSVMAVYGIRESRDLDFLCHGSDDLITGHQLIACHNDEVYHYETSKDDIIFNPENHFYFKGVKFASLSMIRSMKAKRNEAKDVQDVALINNFLKTDPSLSSNRTKTPLSQLAKEKPVIKTGPAKLINYVYRHTQSTGYAIHKGNVSIVWSAKPIAGCDLYYFQDAFSYSKGLPNINVLGIHEPIVVLPRQYTEKVLKSFDYIITSIETLVARGSNYIKFFHPAFDTPTGVKSDQALSLMNELSVKEKKDAVCMISGNKRSMVAGELYSKRVEAAKWFYDHSKIPFDVYGRPPFKELPNYRGELIPYEEKFHVLSQYKYSLCFENIYDLVWSKGYISEKILHCIMCGTVPIYWGCSNIEKYIPNDCFIDFRRVKNYAELDRYLQEITDAEYRSYLANMQAWVKKGNLASYSIYKLYDQLAILVDSTLSGKEFAEKPWLPGKAAEHSAKQQILPLEAVWSFQDLAKPPARLPLLQQPERLRNQKANIITGLIFSKNRAMQLDCVLKSFFLHCIDSKNIDLKVLYTTSDQVHEAQYKQISGSYRNVEFVKESEFKKDLLMLVASCDYILFLVDDNIFVCDFFLNDAVKSLAIHSDAIGFSLRLGKNITGSFYPSRKKWTIPEFERVASKVLKFDWTNADANRGFGYPLEVSSSIYRSADVYSVLESENFTNPNTLELILDQHKTDDKELYNKLLCYEQSVTFCNPVNLVQSAWKNYAGNSREYSADNLARKYELGYRIDAEAYSGFPNSAYHQEVEIVFKKQEKDESRQANSGRSAIQSKKHMVTIIILNYNGMSHIQNCLNSINAFTSQPYEIIVVDNASTDGSRDILRSREDILLVENATNLGCPPARAQALALASGEYVVLLDNDIIVTPGWFKKLTDHFNNHPEIGILGPRSNFVSGPQLVRDITYQTVDELKELARKLYQDQKGYLTETSRLVGFCMAIRRSVIKKIGGLDPRFGKFGFEDDDYSWRAKIAGFKIAIAHDVFIHHFGGPQVRGDILYNKLLKEAWEIFKKKWGLPVALKYGERFDTTGILRCPFDPQTHFVPLPKKEMVESLIFQQNNKGAGARARLNGKGPNKQKTASKSAQNRFQQIIDESNMLHQQGRIDAAVDILIGAIKQSPSAKRLYYSFAKILIDTGQYDDALDILDMMPPDNNDSRKMELSGYCKKGKQAFAEALLDADRALAVDPKAHLALNLKGMLASRDGDRDAAEKYFQRALESNPEYGPAYTNLGALKLEKGLTQEALALFEKGFIYTPQVKNVAVNYHKLISELGAYQSGEQLFREAVLTYPENKKLAYLFIDILLEQNKYKAALDAIEESIVRFGFDAGLLASASKIRNILGPMKIEEKSGDRSSLSLCMIVRNEENSLPQCLKSVKPIVDEIIIVDTGSTDSTKEIAQIFGANLFEYEWDDDFAGARNFSLSRANGKWILILDADEALAWQDYRFIAEILGRRNPEAAAYQLITRNYTSDSSLEGWQPNQGEYEELEAGQGWVPSKKVRLFPNDSRIIFEKPVHELVENALRRAGIAIMESEVPVHHYGKLDKSGTTPKDEAYYRICRKKVLQQGDDLAGLTDLALLAAELKRYEEAVELWERVLKLKPDFATAFFNLGYAYIELEQYDKGLAASCRALELDPGLKEAVLNRALCEIRTGKSNSAVGLLGDFLLKTTDHPVATGMLAVAYSVAGDIKNGVKCFEIIKKMGFDCREYIFEHAEKLISAGRKGDAELLITAAEASKNSDKKIQALISGPSDVCLGRQPIRIFYPDISRHYPGYSQLPPSLSNCHNMNGGNFSTVNKVEDADFIFFLCSIDSLFHRLGKTEFRRFLQQLPFFNKHEEKCVFFLLDDILPPLDIKSVIYRVNHAGTNIDLNSITLPCDFEKPVSSDLDITDCGMHVNFVGALVTNDLRAYMLLPFLDKNKLGVFSRILAKMDDLLANRKKLEAYALKMEEAVDSAKDLFPVITSYKGIGYYLDISVEQYPRLSENMRKQRQALYFDMMQRSVATLCPKGFGAQSIRFFETMSCGRIPVLISDDYLLPLENRINYNAFICRLGEDEIGGIRDNLALFFNGHTDEEIVNMGSAACQTWSEYFAPAVREKYFFLTLSDVLENNYCLNRRLQR